MGDSKKENLIMSLPNQLTVFRIVLTPFFAVLLIAKLYYLSLILFVIATLTDWYDGYAARKMGKITPFGKYLDPLADKLLISTAFGALTYMGIVPFWMFLVIALRDVLITALRSYATSTEQPFETVGFAKWKTGCQMAAIYLILFWIIANEKFTESSTTQAVIKLDEKFGLVNNFMLFVTIYTLASGLFYLVENRSVFKRMVIAFYRVFMPTNVP